VVNKYFVVSPGIEPVTKGSNRRRKADGSTPVMCHAHNEPRWRSIPAQTAIICICWEPANTNYVNVPAGLRCLLFPKNWLI